MACKTIKTFTSRWLRAAGLTDIKEKLLKGTKLGDSKLTYKVHLDGFTSSKCGLASQRNRRGKPISNTTRPS